MSEKNSPENAPENAHPDADQVAAIAQRIDSLRESAENGELGDELEDVTGGHVNTTHTSSTHSNSPSEISPIDFGPGVVT